jgi:phosphoenolpyruvate carboxylase
MVEAANDLSDLKATRAYAAVFDPTMWLERAAAAADPLAEDQRLSRAAERAQAGEPLAGAARELMADALCLPQDLRARTDERRARLRLLHALRCALIQRICLLAAELPDLPAGASVTREDLRARLMRLDVPWTVDRLRTLFPLQESSGLEDADFGEPSDYRVDVSHSHRDEHDRLIAPLGQLFDLCLRISTAVTHEIGACG